MKKENVIKNKSHATLDVKSLLVSNNEIPYQVRDDGRVASGFTASLVTPQECSAGYSEARHGFTLVELLVVVLIIGILAAVALPQYQKAVDKSRYASMMQAARSIENAQETYFMENGEYATEWDQLPVSLPEGLPTNSEGRPVLGVGGFAIGIANTSAIYYIGDDRVAAFTQYHNSNEDNGDYAGKAFCFSYKNSYRERAKAICSAFGGKLKSTNNKCDSTRPCETYALSE